MCHAAALLSFYWNFISCTRILGGHFSPASWGLVNKLLSFEGHKFPGKLRNIVINHTSLVSGISYLCRTCYASLCLFLESPEVMRLQSNIFWSTREKWGKKFIKKKKKNIADYATFYAWSSFILNLCNFDSLWNHGLLCDRRGWELRETTKQIH